MGVLGYIAAWEIGLHVYTQRLRRKYYQIAEAKAAEYGKPLLVVGNPKGRHGCGDVLVDIAPRGTCPREVASEVSTMPMFRDNEFGAVFVGHVLEHIPLADARRAIQELHRIAHYGVILFPCRGSLQARVHPGHDPQSLAWLCSLNSDGILEWEG